MENEFLFCQLRTLFLIASALKLAPNSMHNLTVLLEHVVQAFPLGYFRVGPDLSISGEAVNDVVRKQ